MTEHHLKLDAFRIALLFAILLSPLKLHPALAATKKPTPATSRKKPATKPGSPHSRIATAKPHPTAIRSKTTPRTRSLRSRALAPAAPPAPRYTPAAIEETLAEPQSTPFLYSHNLDPFFHSLAAEQAEHTPNPNAQSTIPALASTIRILQFGDSHTAADLFTGDLRAQLQSRFGNGGLGFQFPGHPFAGYHLAGSTRTQTPGWTTEGNKFTQLGDGDLGLGGISLSTTRPGESIQLITTCSTFQIHYLAQPGGGTLRFTDNGTFISDLDTSNGNPSPLTTSDPSIPPSSATSQDLSSFAAGSAAGAGGGPASRTTTGPSRTPAAGTLTYACTSGEHDLRLTTLDHAPVRLLGLVTEQPGITYECLGINGAVATLMLRWNQRLFADYLRQRSPNLIVLAYGTNEAAVHSEDYFTQFKRLLTNLHTYVPQAAILVLGPYDRATKVGRGRRASWQTFSGTERIIDEQKEACREEHCAFYDARKRMGGPGSMIRWASAGLAQGDHTHLTGAGYRDLAEALYRDLMTAYQSYQQSPASAHKSSTALPLQSSSYHPSRQQNEQPTWIKNPESSKSYKP